MELLSGGSLRTELTLRKPIPFLETAWALDRALDVLAAAHAAGLVHRDVKPDNLFLTRGPGGTTRLKLLDFGLARETKAEAPPESGGAISSVSILMGTPGYIAPEIVAGAEATPASDQWAIAATGVELLTGVRLKFDRPDMPLRDLVEEVVSVITTVASGVPVTYARSLAKAMAVDPDDRWVNVLALRRALFRSTGGRIPGDGDVRFEVLREGDRAAGGRRREGPQPRPGSDDEDPDLARRHAEPLSGRGRERLEPLPRDLDLERRAVVGDELEADDGARRRDVPDRREEALGLAGVPRQVDLPRARVAGGRERTRPGGARGSRRRAGRGARGRSATRPWKMFTEPRKSRTKGAGGLLEELLGRAVLDDPAAVEEDDAVGDLERLLLVVRHEEAREVDLVVEPPEPAAQLLPHAGVERPERLVEEEDLRLDGEGAREGDPLPLARRRARTGGGRRASRAGRASGAR